MGAVLNGYQEVPGIQIGGQDKPVVNYITVYTPALSPTAVNANTTTEKTFTVTGLAADDVILSVTKPTAQAGLGIVGYRVSAANQLAITFSNNTGSPITPTAGQVYTIIVINTFSF